MCAKWMIYMILVIIIHANLFLVGNNNQDQLSPFNSSEFKMPEAMFCILCWQKDTYPGHLRHFDKTMG